MEGDPRMTVEPGANVGRLVAGHVLEDDMELAGGVGPLDMAEEGQEVGSRVASSGFGGDLAGGHLERGEQAHGAVPLVVVGVALDLASAASAASAGSDRTPGSPVFSSRDRTIARSGGAMYNPTTSRTFAPRSGSVLNSQRLGPMRLETDRLPDPPDGRLAHRHPARQPAGAPVGRPVGRRLEGQGDDLIALVASVRRRASRTGGI